MRIEKVVLITFFCVLGLISCARIFPKGSITLIMCFFYSESLTKNILLGGVLFLICIEIGMPVLHRYS